MPAEDFEVGRMDACLAEGGSAPSVALMGTNFISTASVTSFSSGDSFLLTHEIEVISSSMSALSINPLAIHVDCIIPSIRVTSPEPLVSISEDNTSESSFIDYGL